MAPNGRLVDVVVNAGQPARQAFTYREPAGMRVRLGQALFVPFGARILQGIATGFPEEAGVEGVREIDAIADPEPVLDEARIRLAYWLSETYLAPLWDCVAVCLPKGYGQKHVTMVSPVDVPPLFPANPRDRAILAALAPGKQMTLDALRAKAGPVTTERLRNLQEAGHLVVAQGLVRPGGNVRTEQRLRPARERSELEQEAAERKQRQPRSVAARLLDALAKTRELNLREARDLGAGRRHIDELVDGGWVEEVEVQLDRAPAGGMTFEPRPPLRLSAGQQAVADAIWDSAPGSQHLVHGVTGSGKTEVYLDLVRRSLDAGGSAIVLVPEISLTPQAIRRFGERFPGDLTIFHSQLSTGELYDQWYHVHEGRRRLVLGSRSALFTPCHDLRLIVLDEEHEPSYKQSDPQPRYQARDAARELARLTGARLVMGSATPDITTYYAVEAGEAQLHELHQRLVPDDKGGTRPGTAPTIRVVDMREELKAGNRGMFSVPLKRAVRTALDEGHQVMLFVNRRGAARFLLCRDCAYVPECPNCRVAFSLEGYESIAPRAVCHHCGRSRKLEERCPRCHSPRFRPFGVGTQRVEWETRKTFPGARVARWDSSTSRAKGAHERLVAGLEAGTIDIVVGTQILAKGLDLPRLTVAGVVDADVGLHLPVYHAPERTFQLLSQVAGRAGRRDLPGYAFIQTYEPDHPAIRAAAESNYQVFYERELTHRRRVGYPPFGRLARLTFHHPNQEHGLEEASRVATELRTRRDIAGKADPDVLGPTAAYIRRIRGDYRWGILLRGRSPGDLVRGVRLGPRWTVDIDPVNLL